MKLEDRIEIANLASEYGALLTVKQAEIVHLYAEMDMSLYEIAVEYGITRQAVRDNIVRALATLERYEAAVGKLKLKNDIECRLTALERVVGGEAQVEITAIRNLLED